MRWLGGITDLMDMSLSELQYIYTMEYYSAIKKNTFESVLMTWMNLEPIIQSEVRKRKINIVDMYHTFFIHSSVDQHLGCFHVLAAVKSAAVNIGVYVSFSVLVSSGYMPRSGISESHGVFIPSFLMNLHTIHLP